MNKLAENSPLAHATKSGAPSINSSNPPVVIENILSGNFPYSARQVPLATVSARGTHGREYFIIAED